jgi:hypothetical protein
MRAILLWLLLVAATGCETQSYCSPEQEKTIAPEGGLKRVIRDTEKICSLLEEDSTECREARKELKSLVFCYCYLTR